MLEATIPTGKKCVSYLPESVPFWIFIIDCEKRFLKISVKTKRKRKFEIARAVVIYLWLTQWNMTVNSKIFFQNAAQTVRLDGDIICQQNEVRPWLTEPSGGGSGSVEDVRSVCSCTAFDPFHIKAKRRLKKAAKAARQHRRETLETEDTLGGGTRCSTTMKWYSTDSLHTNAQRSPVAVQVCKY